MEEVSGESAGDASAVRLVSFKRLESPRNSVVYPSGAESVENSSNGLTTSTTLDTLAESQDAVSFAEKATKLETSGHELCDSIEITVTDCGSSFVSSTETLPELESTVHVVEPSKPSSPSTIKISEAECLKLQDTSLVMTKTQNVKFKNFYHEVRAEKDVERFLSNPTCLMDLHDSSPMAIIDAMLAKLKEQKKIDCNLVEARRQIFIKDSVQSLAHTILETELSEEDVTELSNNWLVTMAELSSLQQSQVAFARLKQAANFGPPHSSIRFVVLVLTPNRTKSTKSSMETGRTFATLMSDIETRQFLLDAETEDEFKTVLAERKAELASRKYNKRLRSRSRIVSRTSSFSVQQNPNEPPKNSTFGRFGKGLLNDLKARLPHYLSDFKDGVTGHRTIQKLISTVLFLYCACLLPAIAFGVLNSRNTGGKLDVQKVIVAQTFGGITFALFGGQPLVILLTTAPLALYVKVIYSVSEAFELDFLAMYCCVGLWNMFFMIIFSLFGLSHIMKWSTRSTEEIFALFIAVAFTTDAITSMYKEYTYHFNNVACTMSLEELRNSTNTQYRTCHRDSGVLCILLTLGTVWLGLTLYNFRKSPYLDAGKREALADYALVASVLLVAFLGSYVFIGIPVTQFEYSNRSLFSIPRLSSLSWTAVLAAAGLGFSLSLLFFMDQNISGAMVNNPRNKLKKGSAYNWDLVVVALINGVLSLFGLPWVHGALPHSPLHVRALADVEEHVDQGHVTEIIVRVRETRLSGLLSHVLIALSLLMLPIPLVYIPTAVLDGLFLFVAVTSLDGNQLFERALLLVTEQAAYPPSHYIRRVPQRKIHLFTASQLLQLAVLCAFGFSPIPYLKMIFPVLLLLLLPISLTTNAIKQFIDKQDVSPLCRMCGKWPETIIHITAECQQLAGREYKLWRHNKVAQVLRWQMCDVYGF